jgi:hypothetical protein
MSNSSEKVKATVLIDKTLKKLAQVHAIQNDMSFGALIEKALKNQVSLLSSDLLEKERICKSLTIPLPFCKLLLCVPAKVHQVAVYLLIFTGNFRWKYFDKWCG